jgi:hypothetical protein
MTATGCGYKGFEFGARYLDSICLDGWLWDADSGDSNGMTVGGEFACPKCNPEIYMEQFGCDEAEVNRRVARAFGPTPWIPSSGPRQGD